MLASGFTFRVSGTSVRSVSCGSSLAAIRFACAHAAPENAASSANETRVFRIGIPRLICNVVLSKQLR